MTSNEKAAPCPQNGQAETTHRPWCWPDCDRLSEHAKHEHVLSIARLNYGPRVLIGLANEADVPEHDEVLLLARMEDDSETGLLLAPEEARMLARFLTEAADQLEVASRG
jgi:hypothetical protein